MHRLLVAPAVMGMLLLAACSDDPPTQSFAPDRLVHVELESTDWNWSSLPAEYGAPGDPARLMAPTDRGLARWFSPVPAVVAGQINPTLAAWERDDVVPALQLHLESPSGSWRRHEFAGIMRGFSRPMNLTQAKFLEFWVNDRRGAPPDQPTSPGLPREGRLHFDFGFINEDFCWLPGPSGSLERFTFQFEDENLDGQVSTAEDVGLDRGPDGAEGDPYFPLQIRGPGSDTAGDDFRTVDSVRGHPFPWINGTEKNQRLDSEDLNRNARLDLSDGYFTVVVDLADTTEVIAEIYRDYANLRGFIQDAIARGDSWRKYRVDLRRMVGRQSQDDQGGYLPRTPDLADVRFVRVWYDNPDGMLQEPTRDIILAEMRFSIIP